MVCGFYRLGYSGSERGSQGATRGHTGIVISPAGAGFATVEGNTNKAGSRDGDGVYSKSQSWTDPRTLGFFDPVALSAAYLPQVKNV